MSSAARVALVATLLASCWLSFKVVHHYRGAFAGMFYIGADAPMPPELDADMHRVRDPWGYDGQYYHLIAHDPLMRRGFDRYLDNARLRWRRIGVPAMAWLVAAGNDALVDPAYLAIQLLFVFLGTYWLSRLTGNSPAGLAFLLIPATLVSLDRMTVDLPLAAIVIGILLFAESAGLPLWLLLIAAPLVRETGIVLTVAVVIHAILTRRSGIAVHTALTAIPALAWWMYVHAHTPPDGTAWITPIPFGGLIAHTLAGGDGTPGTTLWLLAAHATEQLALAGIWAAIILTLLSVRKRPDLPLIVAMLFVAFYSLVGKADVWDTAYAAGRTMSPLLLALAVMGWRERRWVLLLPLLLILPRIGLQYEAEALYKPPPPVTITK